MANSTIKSPTSIVLGAIQSKEIAKTTTSGNYTPLGIDSNDYILLSLSEKTNSALGAVICYATAGHTYFAYVYNADGTPYNGEVTLVAYYIHK